MTAGLPGAQQRGGKQPLAGLRRGGQLCAPTLPGRDNFSGLGGDRQASTQSGGLVVVIDQVVLAVDHLNAADLEADDLTGAPASVTQDLVNGLMHCPQICGAHRAEWCRRAQQG